MRAGERRVPPSRCPTRRPRRRRSRRSTWPASRPRSASVTRRRGLSTAIDKIDPNILADMIIKATSLQEKANAALRDKGSPYRVAEIGIAASIPPQVTFSIGRIDDPEQAPPAADLIESTELLEDSPLDDMEIVSLDGTVVLDLEAADGSDAEAAPARLPARRSRRTPHRLGPDPGQPRPPSPTRSARRRRRPAAGSTARPSRAR